jgi:PAS domain-containing protein
LAKSNVEIVLLKQLASCLAMPMFVLGPEGELLYFNESAEPILARRFDETGMMSVDEWVDLIRTTDEDGVPVKEEERPLIAALKRREPTNRRFWLRGFDARHRLVEGTAIPLIDLAGRLIGALGIFWEPVRGDGPAHSAGPLSTPGQHEVEIILTQRIASRLAIPIFLIDVDGRLLFFNKAAEPMLGQRFEDFVGTSREQMYETFRPSKANGTAMKREDHPLWIARVRCEPVHRPVRIRGLDGVDRSLEVTAIPLIGQRGRMLGVVGLFWEAESIGSPPA